ncbi:hypothetical protein GCM10023149_50770 [Mucilaginibacter gynuensis]|uniref:Uncharacterized protein n=1 Tax=Mucilaginibacter gynuensis TaxID=1302236 RepID=A0ABP8HIV4_9SPHI
MSNLTGPEGTIPVPDAEQWAKNWRTFLETSKQPFQTRSFLLPIYDFQNIIKFNPTADGVRAYIGLEDPADPTSAKLMLVPTVDGKDVPFIEGNGKDVAEGGQSNVYDLSGACPPNCGPGPSLGD